MKKTITYKEIDNLFINNNLKTILDKENRFEYVKTIESELYSYLFMPLNDKEIDYFKSLFSIYIKEILIPIILENKEMINDSIICNIIKNKEINKLLNISLISDNKDFIELKEILNK